MTEEKSAGPSLFKKPGQLAAALSKFQGDVAVVSKNKKATIASERTGKSFQYAYADLATIAEEAYPKLAENGLSFTASPTMNEHGFVLEYALMHESGEYRAGEWPLPDPRSNDIKQIGIAITYARRYCFGAVTGVVTEEDTDTQGAQSTPHRPAPPKEAVPKFGPNDRRTPAQSNRIFAMLGELGLDYKSEEGKAEVLDLFGGWLDKDVTSTRDLTIREANKIIDDLKIMIDNHPLAIDPTTGEVGPAFPEGDR